MSAAKDYDVIDVEVMVQNYWRYLKMSEKKRLQNQTLNSDDNKKIEDGAEALKDSMKVAACFGCFDI